MRRRRGNKNNAKRIEVDGMMFDSINEGRRYVELKQLEERGVISDLMCNPSFVLQEGMVDAQGNKYRPMKYTADFRYTDEFGRDVVEEFKNPYNRKGEAYRLRLKLFLNLYREVYFRETM